jgi:hypothetical protein
MSACAAKLHAAAVERPLAWGLRCSSHCAAGGRGSRNRDDGPGRDARDQRARGHRQHEQMAAPIAALRGSPARRCRSGSSRAGWAEDPVAGEDGHPCAGVQAVNVVRRHATYVPPHSVVCTGQSVAWARLNAAPDGVLQAAEAASGAGQWSCPAARAGSRTGVAASAVMQPRESDLARRITSTAAGGAAAERARPRQRLFLQHALGFGTGPSQLVPCRLCLSSCASARAHSFPRIPPGQRRRRLVCAPFAAPDSAAPRAANQRRCFRELLHGFVRPIPRCVRPTAASLVTKADAGEAGTQKRPCPTLCAPPPPSPVSTVAPRGPAAHRTGTLAYR